MSLKRLPRQSEIILKNNLFFLNSGSVQFQSVSKQVYQGTVDEELKFITYVDQATEDLKEIRIADSVKKAHIPSGGKVRIVCSWKISMYRNN